MSAIDTAPAENETPEIPEPTYYSLEGALDTIQDGSLGVKELSSADSDLRIVLLRTDVQLQVGSIRHHEQRYEILELLADSLGENAVVFDDVEHSYLYGRAKSLTDEYAGVPEHLQEMLGLSQDATAHDVYNVLARVSPNGGLKIVHEENSDDASTVLDKKSAITVHELIWALREQNPERFEAVLAVNEAIMQSKAQIPPCSPFPVFTNKSHDGSQASGDSVE